MISRRFGWLDLSSAAFPAQENMRQINPVFVIVDRPAIIGPAIKAFEGDDGVELLIAKSKREMDAAVEEDGGIIPIVGIDREDGPEDAVRTASRGAKLVICVSVSGGGTARLRQLAPTGFMLNASTPEDLLKALQAALS